MYERVEGGRGRWQSNWEIPPLPTCLTTAKIPFCRWTRRRCGSHRPGPSCVARWRCRRAEGVRRGEGSGEAQWDSRILEAGVAGDQCPTAPGGVGGQGGGGSGRRRERERCASGGSDIKPGRVQSREESWDKLKGMRP